MHSKRLTTLLFASYLLLLTWMIVFKMDMGLGFMPRLSFRSLNLIPLAGTAVYDGVLDYPEILFNIFSFIPFGIYMEMLFKKASWVRNLSIILLVSFLFEVIQYSFMIGVADVTDLLANGFGGAIGINIMYILTSIWKEKAYSTINCLGSIITLISLVVIWFSVR